LRRLGITDGAVKSEKHCFKHFGTARPNMTALSTPLPKLELPAWSLDTEQSLPKSNLRDSLIAQTAFHFMYIA
jgi:hypothetical protein